jgi:O-antigen/teichoic acid export membrane protein
MLDRMWHGAALNLVARAMAMLLGLAILVIVARAGPRVQGAFSLFVAIEAALVALGSGLGLLLAREAAHARGALQARRLVQVLGIAVAAGTIAGGVLLGASRFSDAEPFDHLWLLAIAAPCLLFAPTVTGLWMGQGKLVSLGTALVASPALVLALLAVVGAAGLPAVTGALAAWVAGRTLVGVGAVVLALKRAGKNPVTGSYPVTSTRDAGRFVAMIALANIVSLANYRASLFLMERTHGLAVAGIYSVAAQLAELLWLLSWAVTVSTYSAIGSADAGSAATTTARAVRVGLAAVLVAAPLLAFAAWMLLPRILGESYRASLTPLLLLLPGVSAYAAASALSAYYTQHRGQPHWAAGIAALSLVLTLTVGAWAIPRWGANGGALATTVGYVVAIVIACGRFSRDTGIHWSALLPGVGARARST